MKQLTLRGGIRAAVVAAAVIVAIAGLDTATIVLGVISGTIYALIAAGITLVYRGSRVLNFAQAEIGTISLYATWWVSTEQGQPWVVGALASVVVAVAIGLLFERIIIRPMLEGPRVPIAVATIGLLTALATLQIIWFGPSPRYLPQPLEGDGITVGGIVIGPPQLLSFAVVGFIAVALTLFLRYTDFGLGVLASADDSVAARLMGVKQAHVSAFTWGTAGALSATAVLFIQPTIGLLAPSAFAGLFIGGLTAALLGGLSSLPGAFIGGLAVGILEADIKVNITTTSLPGVTSLGMLAIVLFVLLVRPQGLLGRSS